MTARAAFAAALVSTLALVLAGCAATSGHGTAGPTGTGTGGTSSSASGSPDFPTGSATSTAPTSSPAPSSSASSSSAAQQSEATRSARLSAQASGRTHVIVKVPHGYQAAAFDQAGAISFWYEATSATSWRQIGNSTYPHDPRNGALHAKAAGALLHRMADATFVVRGVFTGDGTGNAVAFTTGSKGWGAIKAESNGNIGPSGAPVNPDNQIGLSYDFQLVDGNLVTEDCPTDRAVADCDNHPIRKVWHWTGHDFETG